MVSSRKGEQAPNPTSPKEKTMSQTTDTSRPVRCINEALGDPVVFDSLSEMEQAVAQLCDASTGETYMPEDGLQEGRDYEYVRSED